LAASARSGQSLAVHTDDAPGNQPEFRDLARASAPILRNVLEDVSNSIGLSLEARVRWITPEEQQARDEYLDRLSGDPHTVIVRLGAVDETKPFARPLDEYEGYWALELPGSANMIHEPADVVDLIQEDVIEYLWQSGRSASRPECPEHGGHPLDPVLVDAVIAWRCPRGSVTIPLGRLGADPRFGSGRSSQQ
jgi:hypothetical protein